LKIALKVDPILKELSVLVEGDKLHDDAKTEASEILAILIRLGGKTVQQAMSAQIQTSLRSVV